MDLDDMHIMKVCCVGKEIKFSGKWVKFPVGIYENLCEQGYGSHSYCPNCYADVFENRREKPRRTIIDRSK